MTPAGRRVSVLLLHGRELGLLIDAASGRRKSREPGQRVLRRQAFHLVEGVIVRVFRSLQVFMVVRSLHQRAIETDLLPVETISAPENPRAWPYQARAADRTGHHYPALSGTVGSRTRRPQNRV